MREKGRNGNVLTNIQKIALVQEVLENEVRPELEKDGGDIELIDIDGNNVIVALRGQCVGLSGLGIYP